jgi:hypothetical protein
LQGHLALAVPLGARNIGASQAAGTANPNAFGAKVHGGLQGALHGAAEADPTLKLHCHVFSDKLGIQFRRAHLNNVDLDLGTATDLRNVAGHSLDLRTLPSDHEAGAGGVERHAHTVPGTLYDDLGEGCELQTASEILTYSEVFVQLLLVVFAFGIPLGTPITVDDESESDGIYFLSHNTLC